MLGIYDGYMIDITTRIGVLKKILSPVQYLSESCEIVFSQDGVKIPAADKMNVAVADIKVEPEAFDRFSTENCRIGLQMSKFTKILNKSNNDNKVQLYLEDEDLLHAKVENKEFMLGLISLDSVPKQPGLPSYDFSCDFYVEKGVLKDAIETTGVFGNKVVIDVDDINKIIWLNARGDIDRTKVTLSHDMIDINLLSDVENSFDQNYLSGIISTIPDDTQLNVQLNNESPLRLTYSLFEGSGEVEVTLAAWKEGTSPS